MSTTTIYVLRLEGGRYYVGKTDNVAKRYQQHLNGQGSAWTRKYKPIGLEKMIPNVSSFEEDKVTKEYMSKVGIDKVRGGSYVEIELSEFHKEALKMEIWSAKDKCTKCGRAGHFVKDCYATTDVSGNRIDSTDDGFINQWRPLSVGSDSSSTSTESSDEEWECDYCDRTFTTAFGCSVHEKSCRGKATVKNTSGTCYRCGNTGHYSPDCYATRHVKGYYLN